MYPNNTLWPTWYNPGNINAHDLVGKVATAFGVTRQEMCGPIRQRPLPQARAVVAKILRERGMSYKQAGRFFGDRDHTTIRYACENFETHARKDHRVMPVYERLRDML